MARPALAGRYELTSPIGRGGMGEVWVAYDQRLDRQVAVKLLRADVLPSGVDHLNLAKRFVRESRLTARVEHPGVPAVFDAGVEGDRLYLVMQLVPGLDLADFIAQRTALPVESAAAITAQICSVLAAAHAVSLVHRDLKPRNVMIRPDGTVVVLDFGVAALLEPDITRLTTTGETLGSPAYMSPEQVIGGAPSPRSDLYALGCMLHEMLSGARPFTADGSFAVMRQHVEEPPPPLRAHREDVPKPLEQLVLALLSKEPAERPADAQEVYERLRSFLPAAGSPGPDRPTDPTRPYRQPHAPVPRPRRGLGQAERRSVSERDISADDVSALRTRAAELVDAGRFTQAADVLADLLGGLGPSRREARGVRLQLANTLLLAGDYASALSEYEQLIADVAPERDPEDDDVLDWRVQAAVCRQALGQSREALGLLNPVLEIRRRRLGRVAPEVIDLRRQVAQLQASLGQSAEAVVELRRLSADLGARHPLAREIAEVIRRLGG